MTFRSAFDWNEDKAAAGLSCPRGLSLRRGRLLFSSEPHAQTRARRARWGGALDGDGRRPRAAWHRGLHVARREDARARMVIAPESRAMICKAVPHEDVVGCRPARHGGSGARVGRPSPASWPCPKPSWNGRPKPIPLGATLPRDRLRGAEAVRAEAQGAGSPSAWMRTSSISSARPGAAFGRPELNAVLRAYADAVRSVEGRGPAPRAAGQRRLAGPAAKVRKRASFPPPRNRRTPWPARRSR